MFGLDRKLDLYEKVTLESNEIDSKSVGLDFNYFGNPENYEVTDTGSRFLYEVSTSLLKSFLHGNQNDGILQADAVRLILLVLVMEQGIDILEVNGSREGPESREASEDIDRSDSSDSCLSDQSCDLPGNYVSMVEDFLVDHSINTADYFDVANVVVSPHVVEECVANIKEFVHGDVPRSNPFQGYGEMDMQCMRRRTTTSGMRLDLPSEFDHRYGKHDGRSYKSYGNPALLKVKDKHTHTYYLHEQNQFIELFSYKSGEKNDESQFIGAGNFGSVRGRMNSFSDLIVKTVKDSELMPVASNQILLHIRNLSPGVSRHFNPPLVVSEGGAKQIQRRISGNNLKTLVESKAGNLKLTMLDFDSMFNELKQAFSQVDLLHCDLKCENILYDTDNQCLVVVDFDFSKMAGNWVERARYRESNQIALQRAKAEFAHLYKTA